MTCAALASLDQKLWVALSCPVKGLEIDERTLVTIDADEDGHVRPPRSSRPSSWACARLKDPGQLLTGRRRPADRSDRGRPQDRAVADAAGGSSRRSRGPPRP